jgi:hypothetical protein
VNRNRLPVLRDVDERRRPLVELGDPSLEDHVVAGDLLGQHRQVSFDGRLHVGVLVLGVGDEELA